MSSGQAHPAAQVPSRQVDDHEARWDELRRGAKVVHFVPEDLVRRLIVERLGLQDVGYTLYVVTEDSATIKRAVSFELATPIERTEP